MNLEKHPKRITFQEFKQWVSKLRSFHERREVRYGFGSLAEMEAAVKKDSAETAQAIVESAELDGVKQTDMYLRGLIRNLTARNNAGKAISIRQRVQIYYEFSEAVGNQSFDVGEQFNDSASFL